MEIVTEFKTKDMKTQTKSRYKYVYLRQKTSANDNKIWYGCVTRNYKRKTKCFETEREAALFVDLALINFKEEPINILKRK